MASLEFFIDIILPAAPRSNGKTSGCYCSYWAPDDDDELSQFLNKTWEWYVFGFFFVMEIWHQFCNL